MKQPVPVIPLSKCEFDKTRRVIKLASEYIGMPQEFFVLSETTGKQVRFLHVERGDSLFDEDCWDGEQAIYRPYPPIPTVDHMVIYNQY